jgi:hypothetical protein
MFVFLGSIEWNLKLESTKKNNFPIIQIVLISIDCLRNVSTKNKTRYIFKLDRFNNIRTIEKKLFKFNEEFYVGCIVITDNI